jgi:uncharacterized spore protein YtfJ
MEFNLDEMLNKVIDQLRTMSKSETVIGESFKLGEFDCVPVVKISMGFGSGGGSGESTKTNTGQAGVAGAGLGIEPLGFLVTRGDEISMISISRSTGLQSVFEKVPDLLEKLVDAKMKKDNK